MFKVSHTQHGLNIYMSESEYNIMSMHKWAAKVIAEKKIALYRASKGYRIGKQSNTTEKSKTPYRLQLPTVNLDYFPIISEINAYKDISTAEIILNLEGTQGQTYTAPSPRQKRKSKSNKTLPEPTLSEAVEAINSYKEMFKHSMVISADENGMLSVYIHYGKK